MGYCLSLDEYSDAELVAELDRRQDARASGKCGYCGYKADHSDYPKVGVQSGKAQTCCLHPTIGQAVALTFDRLRTRNAARLVRWHGTSADWSGADWGNAMSGESGEVVEVAEQLMAASILTLQVPKAVGTAANTIKKIRRHETGLGTSYNTPEIDELRKRLGNELADVTIYCDLLAGHYDINLGGSVVEKFNAVSVGNDFPERL